MCPKYFPNALGVTFLSMFNLPFPSDGFLFDLLEPWDVRVLSTSKTADLSLQLWVGTFPRFVAIRFYFHSTDTMYHYSYSESN
jgi:hypothetical protein